jgi:mannose-6-phosphate isomerase-like protein (cupin superfamily)
MTFRPVSLSYFDQAPKGYGVIRGQNYTVWRFVHQPGEMHSIASDDEILLIFPEVGGELRIAGEVHQIPPRAFVIVPPSETELSLSGPGRAYALTTGVRQAEPELIINAAQYLERDPRVKPVGASLAAAAHQRDRVRIYRIDDIPFPAGNPRLKFLQTATMSVNWVEYHGPRNRTQLSPHAHDDFEQGSLAITGSFLHHIRTPWVSDANQWREDEHIKASSDSMLVIPPELIHTTEGVGEGQHILIDVFAPPREDFIAKGWVHNADDYVS